MWLQIKNIKTDKEKYIFWEDKNINLTFELVSDNKDYNLNSVFIKYWYQILKGKSKLFTKIETIYLEESLFINWWNSKTFSCVVPIIISNSNNYTDLEEDINNIDYISDYNVLKIKNFIEIIADIKLNPIDCKKIIFPNIELVKLYNTDKKNLDNIDNIFKFDEYLVEKNAPNYVKISNWVFWIGQDYVNIDFYNFLLQKYPLFKIFKLLNIKIISIIFAILFFLFISIDYFKEYFLILLWVFVFIFLPILYIKNILFMKISKDIINIKFKNINFITENLKNKTLKFKDIYDDININYYWKYKCSFNSNLDCVLKVSIQEWKHTRIYEENIFSINLWSYKWDNLSLNNIILNDNISVLEKIFIEPWPINKKTFFTLRTGKYEIYYRVSYNFNSPDLINRNWQLIIK